MMAGSLGKEALAAAAIGTTVNSIPVRSLRTFHNNCESGFWVLLGFWYLKCVVWPVNLINGIQCSNT